MPEKACVSVVVPCYCCSETIGRAISSIAQQSLLPAEIILVDDCSSDETLQELYKVQANYPAGWIKVIACSLNSGAGTARNIGWNAATQMYIAFLDADDSWHPRKIEVQYGWMKNMPSVALSGHACKNVNDGFEVIAKSWDLALSIDFYEVSKNKILLSNPFPTPSVMVRADIGYRFPEGKRYCEDYHLWAEICCAGLLCYRAEAALVYLHKAPYGEAGLSAALWEMEKGELGVYLNIFRRGYIGLPRFVGLAGWSLGKYVKRLFRGRV